MSRTYSSWASNQPLINSDLTRMRLATVTGNEQNQLKNLDKVDGTPHMYINVDVPPPPSMAKIDSRVMQPIMIPRQNSSFFAAPSVVSQPGNVQTKLWPMEKPSKNFSNFESGSSASKRTHKHKHHHHHHGNKHHHHHHHHNRHHRAKSAETIRNRQHQTLLSPSKVMISNPQYIEQDQQQQQQPMVVYREVPNNEGYSYDTQGLASVPYGVEHETGVLDDQQAPLIVYRDANQQQQSLSADGISQQAFFNQDQEGFIHQTDPFSYFPQQQQQSSQIVYCNDPFHQDCLCTTTNSNIIQQSISPQQQQQFVCVDHTPTTIQPTMINQIPVFNSLSTNTTCQPCVNVSQAPLQRTTSVVIQQPQPQLQQLQVVHQPQQQLQVIHQPQHQLQSMQIVQQPQPQFQPLQIVQQPQLQPLQIVQQPQALQVMQQPQQLQFIQQPQSRQLIQFASAAPQVLQTIQPQVLQTIQMPTQAVAASPQILYQRPYDPVVVPFQNQQIAIGSSPLVALSQPSYAPSRIVPATAGIQQQGANMFRHALLRTVADRTGVPVHTGGQIAGGIQLMQPTVAAPVAGGVQLMQPTMGAPMISNQNLLLAGGAQGSASLPIVPLTPGGLLIPFQPSQPVGMRPGLLPRLGGYPTGIRNFSDIQQQMQQRRAQLEQAFAQQNQNYSRIPSPPILSTGVRNPITPYTSGNIFPSGAARARTPFPSLTPATYSRAPSTGLNYAQPSYAGSSGGSVISAQSAPYRPFTG